MSSNELRSDVDARWAGLALALLGIGLAALVVVRLLDPNQYNWDVGWILYVAERMLGGATLYVDLIDENPPLIFWTSMPPVAIARAIGTTPIAVFDLAAPCLAGLSCWVAYRIALRTWPELGRATVFAWTAALASAMVLWPGIDFGQRENLLFIAIVPYLFSAAARASGKPVPAAWAVSAGVLAGLGIAIKPFFVAIFIAVEAGVLTTGRDRWRAAEPITIVAVNALFGAALLVFAPEYVSLIALNLGVTEGYREGYLASIRMRTLLFAIGAAAASFGIRPAEGGEPLRRILLAALAGCLVSAIAQGADFTYRYYPVAAVALVLLIFTALDLARRCPSFAPRAPLAVLVLLLGWTTVTVAMQARRTFAPGPAEHTPVKALTELAREHAAGKSIWVMSTSVNPAFPVVNLAEAEWASRHCCVTLLGHLYPPEERAQDPFPYHAMSQLPDLEQQLFDEVVEDLGRTPPELIIIDAGEWKQTLGKTRFRFLEYFRRDPRFRRFFRDYEFLGAAGNFRVYKRKAAPA